MRKKMKNLYKILTALLMVVAVVFTAQAALASNGLEIVEIKQNGNPVNGSVAIEANPSDEIEFSVKLKNELPQAITGINTDLFKLTTLLASNNGAINLEGNNQTQTVLVKWIVPANFSYGTHNLKFVSVGKNFNNVLVQDVFPFMLKVTQDLSNPTVYITSVTADAATISCKDLLNLNVQIYNSGLSAENDVIIKVRQNDRTIYTSEELSLASKNILNQNVDLEKSSLSSGALTVTVYYRNNYYSNSNSQVSITKESCLSNPKPSAGSLTLKSGQSQLFEVSVRETTTPIAWKLDNGSSIINSSYEYVSDGEDHVLTVTAGGETITWNIEAFVASYDLDVIGSGTLTIAEGNLEREKEFTIKLKNSGNSLGITNLGFTPLRDVIVVTDLTGKTIAVGEELPVTLKVNVSQSLTRGPTPLGKINFTGKSGSTDVNADVTVVLNYPEAPKETFYVVIEDFELNGDDDGEFVPGEENTVEFEVKNDYSSKIEKVKVIINILDSDGSRIDKYSESLDDIKSGKYTKVEATFDLSSEDLEGDQYTVEISLEWEMNNDDYDEILFTENFNVEREDDKIVIRSADLSSTILQCLKQTNLAVEIVNVGEDSQDDVEIRVINTALGINLVRKNIDLDEYDERDNDYEANFAIEVEDNVKAGTYPLTIEVIYGKYKESTTVSLEIKDCNGGTTSTGTYDDLAAKLQQQLQAELAAKKIADQTKVVTSSDFRNSNLYLGLMVGLVLVLILAIILGIAAAAKRK